MQKRDIYIGVAFCIFPLLILSIWQVKFALPVILLTYLFINWSDKAAKSNSVKKSDRYVGLLFFAGGYLALVPAVLLSWTAKLKSAHFHDLIDAASFGLDVLLISFLIFTGIALGAILKRANDDQHDIFKLGKDDRFYDRHSKK